MKNENINSNAIPFFARYLKGQMEIQDLPEFEDLSESKSNSETSGGLLDNYGAMTMKYPSDSDEGAAAWEAYNPNVNININIKKPSDSHQPNSSPFFTMKYPSDSDD